MVNKTKKILILNWLIMLLLTFPFHSANGQTTKRPSSKTPAVPNDTLVIPVSHATLGNFPYFKTLPNFQSSDSQTVNLNRAYFYNGRTYLTLEGKVSQQQLTIKNDAQPIVSIYECIHAFDQTIALLGGVKVFEGKLPEEPLKKLTGMDLVELDSRGQVTKSAFYGVVEYVIKTPEKEIWVQLQPNSLASKFYTLLVLEKVTPLLPLNINKSNPLLADLEQGGKSILHLSFVPDEAELVSDSRPALLDVVGVFQVHPDWKLRLVCHSASVGSPKYALALTTKRAEALKAQLTALGVPGSSLTVSGVGDAQPLDHQDTEAARLANSGIEVMR